MLVSLQGTKWYRVSGTKEEVRGEVISVDLNSGAWGFADGASSIRLWPADVLDSDGDKRLSWHVNRCEVGGWCDNHGGYRCGTTKDLWTDWETQDWERVFYHTD